MTDEFMFLLGTGNKINHFYGSASVHICGQISHWEQEQWQNSDTFLHHPLIHSCLQSTIEAHFVGSALLFFFHEFHS